MSHWRWLMDWDSTSTPWVSCFVNFNVNIYYLMFYLIAFTCCKLPRVASKWDGRHINKMFNNCGNNLFSFLYCYYCTPVFLFSNLMPETFSGVFVFSVWFCLIYFILFWSSSISNKSNCCLTLFNFSVPEFVLYTVFFRV